ncbi:MAG: hypothetical protein DI529_02985 [Chryseobacterium sp.]|nr:MAG: hypothetical protein DI529_02985 [Chryseobacterium sp.]
MKAILLVIAIFFGIPIFACKCDTPTIKGSFESADFVFVGDVYDVNKTYFTAYWNVENVLSKVRVGKIYKSLSSDFKSKDVTFFGQQFNSCDFLFNKKDEYLIFAYIDPDTTFFYSELCLATKPLNQVSDEEFKLLEKLSKDYETQLSNSENTNPELSLVLRTPDKIINDLKRENRQVSDDNQTLKTYLIIVSLFFLVIIIFVILIRKKK